MPKNKFSWQLINDSITKEDKKILTNFINADNVLVGSLPLKEAWKKRT